MENNRTIRILQAAKEGGYAVGAYNCYNDDGIMAVIRAAETKRSPAIIQLFPWTLHFQGDHYVRWAVTAAHAASVPIAVHLDHCIEAADVEHALELPFDSIMVDASTLDEEANIAECRRVVEKATSQGIAIEAEMGRIEGGEDGLPHVDMDNVLTNPEYAREFAKRTGIHFLAPSFGNIHGRYPTGGPEKAWRMELLEEIQKAVPELPLVLHGTHGVSDELFQATIPRGVHKINVNRTVRDNYTDFVTENAGKLELTVLKERGVDVYAKSIMRVMDVFGSSGKA